MITVSYCTHLGLLHTIFNVYGIGLTEGSLVHIAVSVATSYRNHLQFEAHGRL